MEPKLNPLLEPREPSRQVREPNRRDERSSAPSTRPAGPRLALAGGSLAAFLAVGHGVNDVFTSFLPTLLPTLQERFLLTETVLALLVATFSFSTSFPQPLFGALADRLGRRLVGALGIALTAALLSLMAVVPSVPLLFGLLLAGGLGSAALHPAGTSMARAAGGPNKGLAVSLFSAGGMAGYALGPVLLLFVIGTFGLGFTPWLMVPGVLMGVLTYLLMPPQERAPRENRPKLFDAQLFVGPVGLLALSGILKDVAYLTFISAVPLYLVNVRGVPSDAGLLGWTLAVFALAAALGGVVAGALSTRVSRTWLVTGTMLLTPVPLLALFLLEPGTLLFYLSVALAGALLYASSPLMIVTAQDLAPHAVATASGMLIGFTAGVAGLLYIGVGRLQEALGLVPAMGLSYLAMVPAALLALYVLRRHRTTLDETPQRAADVIACACSLCGCPNVAVYPERTCSCRDDDQGLEVVLRSY